MPAVNRFQIEIARVAQWWAGRGCREVVTNGGNCIDDVHRKFGAPAREAYCAKLAWVIIEQAARALGLRNPLPKTAGACTMLTAAVKAGLRVDKNPAIGCVGYHGSDPRFATGHIAVVIDVSPTTMRTVEGNRDDRVDDWTYPLHLVKSRARTQQCQRGTGWDFIHVEDIGGPPDERMDGSMLSTGVSPIAIVAAIGAIATGYALTRAVTA